MDLTVITQIDYLYNLGLNQYYAVNFLPAITNLEKASNHFLQEKQYGKYLKSQNLLIAMYAEMENFNEIEKIRNKITEIIWNHKKEIRIYHARFHYYLGWCFIRKKDYIKAQVQFDQSLAIALKLQKEAQEYHDQQKLILSKLDICYASYGFTSLHIINNNTLEAIQELKNMKTLIEYLKAFSAEDYYKKNSTPSIHIDNLKEDIQSLEFVYTILEAFILSIEKKYDDAETLYWFCYEQSQKNYRKRFLSPHILYFLGNNYIKKADYEQASIFLNLAKKSANPSFLKRISRKIDYSIENLKEEMANNYDIIVSFENKTIVEKQKGYINLKNQFILLDMLKLLISHPGNIYSKESLVEHVWQQKYDPMIHDNKIYVTIKRLRELVEPDYKNPKYIFRAKEGYYISKKIKTLIK